MRTAVQAVCALGLLFSLLPANAASLSIVGTPSVTVDATSVSAASTVRNVDSVRSNNVRLEVWAFLGTYNGGATSDGFKLADSGSLVTTVAAGGSFTASFFVSGYTPPPDGTYVITAVWTEQDGGATNGGYTPRAWHNLAPRVFSGGGTNYTGLWWNPNESGWGLNVNHQGITIFATLFTYGADNQPLWLVGSALARQTDGSFTGPLYRTSGPSFNQVPWTVPTVTQVGTMTIRFNSSAQATVTYTVNNQTVVKSVTPQVFGGNTVCSNTTNSRGALTNYQDLWWNAQESGWGVNLTHQGSIIFATLFTYVNGRDKWFVASAMSRQTNGAWTGALYETTGPAFSAPHSSSAVTVREVGTITASFTNGTSGTLSYSVNGSSVTKPITRQEFSSPRPLCR